MRLLEFSRRSILNLRGRFHYLYSVCWRALPCCEGCGYSSETFATLHLAPEQVWNARVLVRYREDTMSMRSDTSLEPATAPILRCGAVWQFLRESWRRALRGVNRFRRVRQPPDPVVKVKFNGPCCFCGKFIDDTAVDPCSVVVQTREEKWQVWYCHSTCFRNLIAENPYMDLSPAHF